MVIDSTVLIDVLRGKQEASDYLLSEGNGGKLSRVVVMEIVAGSQDKMALKRNMKFVSDLNLEVVEIDSQISALAGELFEKYYLTYGLGVTDALIAATAMNFGEKLVTKNLKHFKFIKGLELQQPY